MIARPASQIRARSRPGAIMVIFALNMLEGGALGLPWGVAVFGTGATRWPGGDQVLFAPGGWLLLEMLWRNRDVWRAALGASTAFAVGAALASMIATLILMIALAHAGRLRASRLVTRSLEHWWPFVGLTGITKCLQGGFVLLGIPASLAVREALRPSLGERNADLALLASVPIGAFGVLGMEILGDLGRAIIVRRRTRALYALAKAVLLARKHAGAALTAYAWRALVTAVVVLGTGAAVQAVGVNASGSWRVLLVFTIHQCAALTATWLHASWLARALALVSSPVTDGLHVRAGGQQLDAPDW